MTGVIVAVGDINGYDDNKGLAQSAFSAVAGLLGLNSTPDAAVTTPAATAETTRDAAADPVASRRAADEQPVADRPTPGDEGMRMLDQQRRMAIMGGGGDVLGNGGSGKAQVFGAASPPKQQPHTPSPGPRGRG